MKNTLNMIALIGFISAIATSSLANPARSWTPPLATGEINMSQLQRAESVQLPKTCGALSATLIEMNYEFEAAPDLQGNLLAVSYINQDRIETKLFDLGQSTAGNSLKAGPNGVILTMKHQNCPVPHRSAQLEVETFEISYAQLCNNPSALTSVQLKGLSNKLVGSCE